MITSAEEFIRLCRSSDRDSRRRLVTEEIHTDVVPVALDLHPELEWSVVIHFLDREPSILERLSDSPDVGIRFWVAANRRLPHTLFEKLARDQDVNVRDAIACNWKTPEHILQRLAEDDCEFVAKVARERLARLAEKTTSE